MDQYYSSYYNQNGAPAPGQGFEQKAKKSDPFGLFFLKRCWIVLLAALVFAGCGFLVARFIVPAGYLSSFTILVSSESNRSGDQLAPISGNNENKQLVKTFAGVLERSDEINGLLENGAKMEVSVLEDTELIQIKVIADSPQDALSCATQIQKYSVELFGDYYNYGRAFCIDSPKFTTNRYRPFVLPSVLISAGAGALLGFIAVSVWYALKKSKK